MSAAGEEQEIGKIETDIDQPRAERMAFEVIDGNQRLACGEREALAREQPYHHPADQARSGGRRDRIHFANCYIRFVEHLADQRRQYLDMRTSGDFGHDAPKRAVRVILADDGLRQYLPVASDQGHGAVVAGRFKGKDQRHRTKPLPQRPALR